MRLSPRAVCFHINKVAVLKSVLLYFTLKDVLTEDTPLKFNTLNKQIDFFDKNVSIVLLFYNYSSIPLPSNHSSIATNFIPYGS